MAFCLTLDATTLYRGTAWNSQRTAVKTILRERPDGLVIGSSRVEGLPTGAAFWPAGLDRRLVVPMYGAAFDELVGGIESGGALDSARYIVVGIDFYGFNVFYRSDLIHPVDTLSLIRSSLSQSLPFKAVVERISLLVTNVISFVERVRKLSLGEPIVVPVAATPQPAVKAWRSEFLRASRVHLAGAYFPAPYENFHLSYPGVGFSAHTGALKRLLAEAREHHIPLKLFIHPTHAWEMELIRQSGLWPAFEEWKRIVAEMVADANATGDAGSAALWDFSGYNCWTTEEVPDSGVMKLHEDMSHYNRALLGRAIMQRMFGGVSDPETSCGADTPGVRLDRANLEAHLARIRAAQTEWLTSHPRDVRDLRELVGQTMKRKPKSLF